MKVVEKLGKKMYINLDMDQENFYVAIIAGGGGTRLWPKSRKSLPKHLLKLFGDQTMIQQTFKRVSAVIPPERILIITLEEYIKPISEQLPKLPGENIIAEPMAKNTAMAMGLATIIVEKRNPNAAIINLPADALIYDNEKYQQAMLQALKVASDTNNIVAVGLRPTFPHTGLGYIKIGEELSELSNKKSGIFVFQGKGFREKPDLATAQSFVASGQYLWNGGIYTWGVKTFIEAAQALDQNLYENIIKISEALGTEKETLMMESCYQNSEGLSIDYAISEKAKNLVVIPGEFGWSDVGDWKVIFDTKEKDKEGNVISEVDEGNGEYVGIDTRNCLIQTSNRLIVTIGLDNIVVVDTPDAVLICHKDKTQDVKKAVEQLKALGDIDCL